MRMSSKLSGSTWRYASWRAPGANVIWGRVAFFHFRDDLYLPDVGSGRRPTLPPDIP